MTASPTPPLTWSQAYARQSLADLDAYDRLKGAKDLPVCQSLHFLQMACEKLVKAHLSAAGSDPDDLKTSHAYIAKNLVIVLRTRVARLIPEEREQSRWLLDWLPPVAREIELLAPAVKAGGSREANCEYPWADPDGSGRCAARPSTHSPTSACSEAGKASSPSNCSAPPRRNWHRPEDDDDGYG
jgi:hypothetical protein